jgi:small subunit ribosomal protein S14
MHYLTIKDEKKRQRVQVFEKNRLILKTIARTQNLPKKLQWKARLKLSQLKRDGSSTRIKNRCVLTGRSKATYRFLKTSRIKLRELASSGLIPGVKKASW